MANLVFIYGTTSGNTEMAVDRLAELFKQKGHQVITRRAELSAPQDVLKGDLTFLASPTYGHGLLQEEMLVYLDRVKSAGISLKNRRYAVIGLGDPKYDPEHHIESAAILERFVTDHQGVLACPSLRLTRSPVLHLEGRIKEWAEDLARVIQ